METYHESITPALYPGLQIEGQVIETSQRGGTNHKGPNSASEGHSGHSDKPVAIGRNRIPILSGQQFCPVQEPTIGRIELPPLKAPCLKILSLRRILAAQNNGIDLLPI